MGWKIKDDFDAIERQLREAMQDVVEETAEDVLKDAKNKAPVDTGALRDSGRLSAPLEIIPGLATRNVEFGVKYASFVEQGFYHVSAFSGDGATNDDGSLKRGRLITGRWFLREAMRAKEDLLMLRTAAALRKLGVKVRPS